MAKQTSRARSEGGFGTRAGGNNMTGKTRKNGIAGGSVHGPSDKVHNPIAAGTVGGGNSVTPEHVGKIAGTPKRQEIKPHARRHGADGSCKPASGYPGHRVGARGD